ncbi:MAG TPA: glycosyltransferase family 4 protein [Polyangiaceae bacterium]|nr:glycosyltransferase family 4 protein [Polyangiaceae bacterium]
MQDAQPGSTIRKLAIIGNHLPRRCGIATFTTDLGDALAQEFSELDPFVLAINDGGHRYAYPERVRFELGENDLASYRRAADFLNVNSVDLTCLQHEYGIFGGKAGSHLLALIRELRMPLVTTLHTILPEPDQFQQGVMADITGLSARLVVMSEAGKRLLADVYRVSEAKIDVIPHGIPAVNPAPRSKYQLGVENNSVILTFGLLSPDKGIEHVIDALPEIVARFPSTIYIVLGATHPHILEQHGEMYRLSLEARARRLGVEGNVLFHDRFVTRSELNEFLSAADIYITPYLSAAQSTSGTLAYAVGAGKAVISTPYPHAQEMLADGRGILVPRRDASAIARAVIDVLGNDAQRRALGARAAAYTSGMSWPKVAHLYQQTFTRARAEYAERRQTQYRVKPFAKRPPELPEQHLGHIHQLTDSTGILQHALFSIPRYEDGYCVDDNARALLLMALIEDGGTDDHAIVRVLASRYLAFVSHAFDYACGRFRNFMSYQRSWTEACGSEDSHGRALWALGTVVGRSRDHGKHSLCGALFQRALAPVSTFSSPRAWAFVLLGIDEYLRAFRGDTSVQALRQLLATNLFELLQRTSTAEWLWFEDQATYENARLCQALIASADAMDRPELKLAGLKSLEWLVSVQYADGGVFSPIGSRGFYQRGGPRALFDQQPLDAWATVSACLQARRSTANESWLQHARRAFAWFLGRNHLQQSVYDATTGGCRDGLHQDRPNENQGAESTLSFQLALLEMRHTELTPALHLVRQGQA